MADSAKRAPRKAPSDSIALVDFHGYWDAPITSTAPPTTTTDPPLSIDSPVSFDDASVSGTCPSGSDVWLRLMPSGYTLAGGFTTDVSWLADGLDLSGSDEVRASVDQFATFVSEPVAQEPPTTTPAPVTDPPATTTAPPTTAPPPPPPPPSYVVVHDNLLTAVSADGVALIAGAPFEFADAGIESASAVAVGGSLVAVAWHGSWGGGRCRIATIGEGEASFGEVSELEGTARGAHGLGSLVRMGAAIAAAYRDGGDCLGKVSLALVGGYPVTTTTAPPATTTTEPPTTTTTGPGTTTTQPPATTTAPPPPSAPSGFKAAGFSPILPPFVPYGMPARRRRISRFPFYPYQGW